MVSDKNKRRKIKQTAIYVVMPVLIIFILFSTISGVFIYLYEQDYVKWTNQKAYLANITAVDYLKMQKGDVYDEGLFWEYIQNISKDFEVDFTIINSAGQVDFDTRIPFDAILELDNHAGRPEVKAAFGNKIGYANRYSKTSDTQRYYVAINIEQGVFSGWIRSSYTLKAIEDAIFNRRLLIAQLTLIFSIVAALVGRYLLKVQNRQIAKINGELEQRVLDRTEALKLMQDYSALLGATQTIDELARIVKQQFPSLVKGSFGFMTIAATEEDVMEIIVSWGQGYADSDILKKDDCWALRAGRSYVYDENTKHLICDHFRSDHIETPDIDKIDMAYVCNPLMAHGELIGSLHIVFADKIVNDRDMDIINTASEQIGLTAANIQMRSGLMDQATRDSLTGAYNRRFMMEALSSEIKKAKRRESNFAVQILDVDHFKSFNDDYGHDVGDQVLVSLVETLNNSFRESDLICRFGGEEFAIITFDVSRKNLEEVQHRFQENLRGVELPNVHGFIRPITVSIGTVFSTDVKMTTQELLHAADMSMYEAKNNGRDQIVYYQDIKPKDQPDNPESN